MATNVTKVLLNYFHSGDASQLARYLPPSKATELSESSLRGDKLDFLLEKNEKKLDRIHYSWLENAIKTFPPNEQPILISCLAESQRDELAKLLKIQTATSAPSPLAREWLLDTLYRAMDMTDVLPLEHLPETPFMMLCKEKQPFLVDIINLLAMHDLVPKLRQIVDTNRLKAIYASLSREEVDYVKTIIHKKDSVVVSELDLKSWQSGQESLRHLLHKRALYRLGRAMAGQPEQVVWHLCHVLDTGRGAIVMRAYKGGSPDKVTDILASQIFDIIEFKKGQRKS